MSEAEAVEYQEHEIENSLLAWFQDGAEYQPALTSHARARLNAVGVPEEHLGRLRADISGLAELHQIPLLLHFSGFSKDVLEALLGDEHENAVETSLRQIGLSTGESAGLTEIAPKVRRPVSERRKVGAATVRKVAPTDQTDELEDSESFDDVTDENGMSPVLIGRPKAVDEFAADAVLGERVLTTDDTKSYLQRIGKVALLTAVEEVELSKRIEAGLYAQHLLETDEATATEATNEELITLAAEGKAAKAHMLQANLRLVVSVAKHYTGYGLDFLDLIQEGNLGLVRAVEKFDYTQGHKFSTYATWWIRQFIHRGIAESGRSIRLPVHINEEVSKIKIIGNRLEVQKGRTPSIDELAHETGMTRAQIIAIKNYSRDILSLDHTITNGKGDPGDMTLGDIIAATPDKSDTIVNRMVIKEALDEVLSPLDSRARDIIERRYGLRSGSPQLLDEISAAWDVSRERIRQILGVAMDKVRLHAARSDIHLEDLFDDSAE